MQAPRTHVRPLRQTLRQVPQFVLLVRRSTSQPLAATPSQFAKLLLHVAMAQALLAHDAVALAREQTVPQAPQFVALLTVLVSQPLAALPSQFAKPVLHVDVQALAAQPRAAFGYVAQITPQPPQLFGSEARFTQLPVAAQNVVPVEHELTQAPPEQTVPAAQTLPQAPQLLFVFSARSQPLAAEPSQLPQPALQLAMPHAPPVHAAVALDGAQVAPHAPQLATEVLVLTSHPFDAEPSQLP